MCKCAGKHMVLDIFEDDGHPLPLHLYLNLFTTIDYVQETCNL